MKDYFEFYYVEEIKKNHICPANVITCEKRGSVIRVFHDNSLVGYLQFKIKIKRLFQLKNPFMLFDMSSNNVYTVKNCAIYLNDDPVILTLNDYPIVELYDKGKKIGEGRKHEDQRCGIETFIFRVEKDVPEDVLYDLYKAIVAFFRIQTDTLDLNICLLPKYKRSTPFYF